MTIEFLLPDIGEGLNEAEVVHWLVAEGDTIERNQPFVEILTDKSSVEMPAPAAGVVTRLGAAPGDIVRVGELLIVIDDGNDGPPVQVGGAHGASGQEETAAANASSASSETSSVPADEASIRRPKASPSTRKLAAQYQLDLTTVTGTGPGGRILADDVERARTRQHEATPAAEISPMASQAHPAAHQPSAPGPASEPPTQSTAPPSPRSGTGLGQAPFGQQPLRGIRRATARAMDRSWSTIPHVSAMNEIDATELLVSRAQLREAAGPNDPRITPLALFVMATARALRRYPLMNATLDLEAETITVHEDVHISIAVASEAGLLVPVIHHADRLGIRGLAAEITRLSVGARDGSLGAEDLADSTFTVSNYGTQGGYFAAPIIRPGESGIVGFGSIDRRPMVVGDDVKARPVLPVVISGDHRLVDGDLLNAFLGDIMDSLRQPVTLLL